MVDNPKLNPQMFSKGTGGAIPRLTAQTPNFRNVPSVTALSSGAVADEMLAMADDGKRLQAISQQGINLGNEMVDKEIAETQTLQALEAEAELDKIMLQAQSAINAVRENEPDASSIPGATRLAYHSVRDKVLDSANLSPYQREYLAPKLQDLETGFARSALEYQTQLRAQEAAFALSEKEQALKLMVQANPQIMSNPDLRAEFLEKKVDASIELFGSGLSQLEKAQMRDSFREELTVTALTAQIALDPDEARPLIAKAAEELRLTADNVESLNSLADAQEKSNRVKTEKEEAEAIKAANRALTESYIMSLKGGPPLSPTDILTRPEFSLASPSTKLSITNALSANQTKAGNPLAYTRMKRDIRRSQNSENPITLEEVLNLADPSKTSSPISGSELENLVRSIEKPANDAVERVIESVQDRFTKNKLDTTGLGDKRLFDFETALDEAIQSKIDTNQDWRPLITQDSGQYIVDDLIKKFLPTDADLVQEQIRSAKESVDSFRQLQQDPVEMSDDDLQRKILEKLGGQ